MCENSSVRLVASSSTLGRKASAAPSRRNRRGPAAWPWACRGATIFLANLPDAQTVAGDFGGSCQIMLYAKRRARSFAAATAGLGAGRLRGVAPPSCYEAVSIALARRRHRRATLRAMRRKRILAKLPPAFRRGRIETLVKVQDPSFLDAWRRRLERAARRHLSRNPWWKSFSPVWTETRKDPQTLIAQLAVGALTQRNTQLAPLHATVNGFDFAARKWFGKPLAELDGARFSRARRHQ